MSTLSLIIFIISVFAICLGLVQMWVFKADKDSSGAQCKKSDKAFEQGDFKKAKELLSKLKGNSLTPEAEYKLGLAHLKLGEYAQAKKCFEEVLKKSPKDADAMFHLAKATELQGNQYEALEIYTKLLGGTAQNIESHLSVGRINLENKNYGKALEILERAKELSPDNPHVLFSIAKCKSELNSSQSTDEYQKTIDECLKLADSADLPVDYEITLAKLYAKNGQIPDAEAFCKKALEKDERDLEAYRLLGLIQLIKKEYDAAKSNLTVALDFEPNNKEAHNLFSYLLCTQVDSCPISECREKYNEAVKKYLDE